MKIKEEYIKFFTKAIKKSDKLLVFDIEHSGHINDDGSVYFEFDYQIYERKGGFLNLLYSRSDKDVVTKLGEIINDEYTISIDRTDAFTNGYAAYKIIIYS